MERCIWITPKNQGEFKNELYYFKKTVTLSKKAGGVCDISAESRYKLYINGQLCAFGPCKGTREKKYFDSFDISKYIKDGENEIFVEVLRLVPVGVYGKPSPVEGVMRKGCCALFAKITNGDNIIRADESWLCAKQEAIELKSPGSCYSASILENVDAKKENLIYEAPAKFGDVHSDVNEHHWWGITSDLFLSTRPIPMLEAKEIKIGFDGEYYDAGYLTFGFPTFKIKGKGKVEIIYFECFGSQDPKIKADRTDRSLGYGKDMVDTVECDGEVTFSPFWFRCFRFIHIKTEGDVSIKLEKFLEVNYPMVVKDTFDFGSKEDNLLFETSVRTLRRCMHETYEDCPFYEQLQYTMDTSLQMLFNYQLTNDDALARNAIEAFANSQFSNGFMPSRYPSVSDQHIPSFQLYFIFMVYQHYIRFGDINLVKKYIGAIDGVISWFKELINEDGILGQSNYWNFIDWAKPWVYDEKRRCDGGVPLGIDEGPIGIYDPMFAYFLECASKLNAVCSRLDVSEEYQNLADALKKNVDKYFYDKEKGLYADDLNHKYYSQHMQTWCVLSGVAKGNKAKKIMKNSLNLEAKSTYAFAYFFFRALEVCGMYDKTKEMMDSYRNLLKLNCTTIPETPTESRSECHAWGAIAIYEFCATVLGVRTYDVFEKSVSIKPYIDGREYAKGTVATIAGDVYVSWKKSGDVFEITVQSEDNVEKVITLPNGETYACSDKVVTLKCNI